MKYSRYFQVSLLWPIVIFLALGLRHTYPTGISFYDVLYAHIYTLLPYIAFAVILYIWFARAHGGRLYFAVFISPLIWGVFYPVFLVIQGLLVTDAKASEIFDGGLMGYGFIFFWSALIAYGFVGLTSIIFFFIKGWLVPNEPK